MEKKICRECRKLKSLDDYYVHSQMGDGYLNKCKECVKARVLIHRGKNLNDIRAYDRKRGRTEKRKARVRQNQKDNPEVHNKATRKHYTKNKEKSYASGLVSRALERGILVRGRCEVCGTNKRVEGHHDDYFKPLSVRWLCYIHHKESHRKYNDPF